MRRLKAIGVLIAAGVLAAACSSNSSTTPPSSSSGSAAPSGTLTIDNESGGTWTCDFNPFNLSYIGYSLGPVYEPLAFVNTLQSGKITPWLATSWAWSNGNKDLTFTIRKGKYISETLQHWHGKEMQMGAIFQQLLAHPDLAHDGYCLEEYLPGDEVRLMVTLHS